MNRPEFYRLAKQKVIDSGFLWEIELVEQRHFKDQTPLGFLLSYVFVVCNSGIRNQIAEKIFNKYRQQGISAINHPLKRKAVLDAEVHYEEWFERLQKSEDKLGYLKSLFFIGDVTKYHLARNLGLDYAKPDRWLTKLAEHFGFSSVQQLCGTISEETGDRIGTVDVVLWRYCNLFGLPS